jgi:hypothetical protein
LLAGYHKIGTKTQKLAGTAQSSSKNLYPTWGCQISENALVLAIAAQFIQANVAPKQAVSEI